MARVMVKFLILPLCMCLSLNKNAFFLLFHLCSIEPSKCLEFGHEIFECKTGVS